MKNTNPINKKEEVQQSNDAHIGQDFEGYPKSPAKENIINPKTKADKLTAQTKEPTTNKQNPPKNKPAKPGEPTKVEKKLSGSLSTAKRNEPNKVKRIKKETK